MAISKDKKKALDGVLDKINKKFGNKTVDYAVNKKDELTIKRLKFPSHEFNIMLHGGIAEGRIIEFAGDQSTGKTTAAILLIKAQQDADPDFIAGWYETEHSVTEKDLESYGIDMDRLIYLDNGELTAEEGLGATRSLIESGEINMIVVNSVAGLCPKAEMESELDKQQMALTARLLSKYFRCITGVAAKNKCTCIFINQLRENLGSLYGGKVTTGGKALGFYATQRLRSSKVKIDSKDPITENEGVKIHWVVKKNRCSEGQCPYRECTYYGIYGVGIDDTIELPDILARNNIVYHEEGKSWYKLFDPNGNVYEINGFKYQWNGKKAFVNALKENPQLKQYFLDLLNGVKVVGNEMSDDEVKQLEEENKAIEDEMSSIDVETSQEETTNTKAKKTKK